MAQYVSFENNWEGLKFHCPACGSEVCSTDGNFTQTPCEHLFFCWIDECGEFENASEEFLNLKEANSEDEDDCEGLHGAPWNEDFLNKLPDDVVMFGIEHHGMACGPVCTTVVYAIKFPTMKEEG